MAISDLDNIYVSRKEEVKFKITKNKKPMEIKFIVHEIGFLDYRNISIQAALNKQNALAMLISESVTDENGDKMTYDQAKRLPKEYADKFIQALDAVNGGAFKEKKSKRPTNSGAN